MNYFRTIFESKRQNLKHTACVLLAHALSAFVLALQCTAKMWVAVIKTKQEKQQLPQPSCYSWHLLKYYALFFVFDITPSLCAV